MSIQKAFEDVKTLTNRFKPLLELGQYLEQVASFEALADEAIAKKSAAENPAVEAEKKLAEARDAIIKAQRDLAGIKVESESYVLNARTEAQAIINTAMEKAGSINKLHAEQKNALLAEVNSVFEMLSKAKSDVLAAEQAEMARKAALLEQIQKELNDAKARADKLGV